MANHRADGRAHVRKSRMTGGTHRDATLPASVVKVGVLGALATATIAAPLAAAAAGIDEAAPTAEGTAASVADVAPAEVPAVDTTAAEPVTLPVAQSVAAETRTDETDDDASRSADREDAEESTEAEGDEAAEETSESAEEPAEDTGIEVSLPEPEPEPTEVAAATGADATAEGAEAGTSAPASSTGYMRPVSGSITSGYGYRTHPVLGYSKMHDGVDMAASCGTPVKASASGTVVAVEYHHASGNRVKIDHGNGVVTGYYHLQGFNTSVGATVSQGDVIGYVGSTGRSTGCHLHFSKMDEAGNYSDPMSLLR